MVVATHFTCSRVWSRVGHYSKALAKGPKTTTWIFNLHADAHDFQILFTTGPQVLSSHLAHLSLVFFWITGLHFHGAEYSNYCSFISDPQVYTPSSHLVWSLTSSSLNTDIGQFSSNIRITSGLFHLWSSEGITSGIQLKYAAIASIIGTNVYWHHWFISISPHQMSFL